MRKLLYFICLFLLGGYTTYSQTSQSGSDPCGPDCPLEFSSAFPSYAVECQSDLPTSCEEYLSDNGIVDLTASNSCTGDEYDVFCTILSANSEVDGGAAVVTECEGYTAKRNNSLDADEFGVSDAALRIYGLSAAGITDSDFFVEDPSNPLQFIHTPNSGTARLTGTVYCRENAAQIFHIDATFDNEENAADWLAASGMHALLIADDPDQPGYQLCTVDETAVSVFDLAEGSHLLGDGDLSGVIQLYHMPSSYSKRFQLGDGVNNHNCNYGLGGWFSWDGVVNGVEISGDSGDIVIDLDNCVEEQLECEEYSEFVFTAIDLDCGRVITSTARVDRDDTTAPVISSGPLDATAECDNVPAVADDSEVIATDNCEGDVTIAYDGEVRVDSDCPDSYILIRRWSATDVCGNASIHTQTLTIEDTAAPVIDPAAADATVECDGAGNGAEFTAWLDSNGGASATDNCGDVTWTNDFTALSDDCGATGSATVTFTATDDCENASSTTVTFTIEDTTNPVLTNDPSITIPCDEYPDDIVYASASDDCGDVTITFMDLPVSGGCLVPVGAYLRTYTATDDCGNTSTSEQVVTLVDEEAPVITGPADYSTMADADDCSADISPAAAGEASATDNCDSDVEITSSDSEWTYTCDGDDDNTEGTRTLTRTWTATDDCGNSSSDTQSITVVDDTAPVGSAEDADVACADYDANTEYGSHSESDNCDTDVATSWVNVETFDVDGAGCYKVRREYTFVDDCDNTSTAEQIITVFDDVAPVFDAYEYNVVVECSDGDGDSIDYLPITATDDCGDVTYSVWSICASGGCPYSMIRFWKATDECGNSTSTEQYVSLYDLTAPELTVPDDYTVSADAADCSADISSAAAGEATATDNCGPEDCWGSEMIFITYVDSDWTYTCDGDDETPEGTRTLTRTWTATDRCDNSMSLDQTITVTDDTAPTGTADDASVSCEDYDASTEYGSHSESDNCDTDVAVSWANVGTFDVLGSGCYSVRREYTFTDDCGNSSTDEQIITVFDDVAPVMTGDLVVQIECSEYPDDNIYVTGEDSCGGDVDITFSDIAVSGGCVHPIGMYLRTYTATDECGNSSIFEQILDLVDTTPPVLTIPADYTVSADADCSADVSTASAGEATATDNCDLDVTITSSDSDWTYTCDGGDDNTEGTRTLTRTWTATDDCDNSTSLDQTITITDDTAPTGTVSDDSVSCEDYDASTEYGSHTESDNCDTDVAVSWVNIEEFDIEGSGCYSVLREYTFTDDCGNSSTAEQIITVFDDVAPVLTNEPEITIPCEDYPDGMIYATATDNCGTVSITFEDLPVSGGCVLDIGAYLRTYTATDDCGNSSTSTQIVTLVDDTAPVFTSVPDDYTIECDEEITYGDATAEDNCSGAEVTVSEEIVQGDCPAEYSIIRTFTATDNCDNSSTATQTISVVDTTAPVITNDAEVSISCDDYPDGEVYASATDNCSDLTITFEDVAIDGGCVLPEGQYERTYTATDACGNSSTSTQLIILTDDVDPEFTSIPADYTAECDEALILDEATASDNCSGVTITYSEETIDGDCANEYTLVRTWTATDNCGNSSSVSQSITVVDTTAPQLTDTCGLMNGEEVEVCCEDISGTVTIPDACELSFTDNCDSDPSSTLTETCVGDNCPTETVDSWCDITSPEALADGETCDNYSPHSMRLFNFPGSEFYTTVSGTVANNIDGTQTYTMTVISTDNPAAGWTVTADYEAGMDWATWSTQPGNHSYKSDCGLGDHTTWLYSMMIDGSASGWGDYAGSELTLSHQPSNGYFGFQIGEGANNKNGNYGFSGWIYYTGSFLEEGVMGSGDLFGDLDCCLPYEISRDYTVSDCAGNTTTFGYTVSVTGEVCEDGDGGVIGNSGGDGSNGGLVTLKDLIVIESLMPNPTSDNSTLIFETGDDISVNIDIMTMSGMLVQDLFQGNVFSNTPMTLEISTSNLDAGMYQVRLNSRDFVVTKKLLVTN